MKKVFFFCASAAMLLTACGTEQFLTTTSSTASQVATAATTVSTVANAASTATNTDGQSAGTALLALYAQYKADGKFDYTNPNNIINTISLLNSCKNLKNVAKGGDYWQSFTNGLVVGSQNLITDQMKEQVTESLKSIIEEKVDTAALSEATSNATTAASSVKTAATSISNLLSLFKE